MDIDIEQQTKRARRRRVLIAITVVSFILLAAVYLLRASLSSTISFNTISTAVVEKGDVENTITAAGEIVPEFEEIISSPIAASIKDVRKNAGTTVGGGESVITLDKSATVTELATKKYQLEAKKNNIRKLKLELDKSFYDLKSNNDIKQLRINSLTAEVENAKRLLKAGGGTQEDVEKAELELKVARLEKQQLENEIKSKQQTMQVEMRQSEIEASIQENDLAELQRKLNSADIVTSRPGVITWVNKNIGAMISPGEPLARIADLSGFKVSGSISDNFLNDIKEGMPAIVRINESKLNGTVTQIYPSIQNNIVQFDVKLDSQSTQLLRPNLKVDVFLVTKAKTGVMRVTNGAAFRGSSPADVFIVKNGKAIRRKVQTGLSNFDFVELLDNVTPGETVIISDMSKFKNADEITITQ